MIVQSQTETASYRTRCNLCDEVGTLAAAQEVIEINSNVRKYSQERFTVWRCNHCRSIHSRDIVELDRYYQDYPFQRQQLNLYWRIGCQELIRRLVRAGLKRDSSLLDYGCGSGLFLKQLRKQGFINTKGYDAFDKRYCDPGVLDNTYDCVFLQDVIEHVEDPAALLDRVASMTKSGGIICIGSPDAENLNLSQPDKCYHSLHQPYHIHILSRQALRSLAYQRGLQVKHFYDVYYADSFIPLANVRYGRYYAEIFDNTMDLAFEKYKFHWRQFMPKGQMLACLGRLNPPRYEMMYVFTKTLPM